MTKSKTKKAAKSSKNKFVYFFGGGKAEGKAQMKGLLGGKGANLAEMTNLGVPVPPGFTITTETCALFYENAKKWPAGLAEQMDANLERLEQVMGAKLGDRDNPLLVSVRSGAAVSMPGMMDTVLNLGLNSEVVQGLIIKTENERFAWDSYRRFIQMFGNVVMGVTHENFEHILEAKKKHAGVKLDTELTPNDLKEIVRQYKKLYLDKTGEEFPNDPKEQLAKAINAVFNSWNNPRAIRYRELNEIRGLLGTAVNVQSMVFGNMGDNSGTGVCFTRDPSTGENKFYGEYLINAQGEDVVTGIRTPEPLDRLKHAKPVIYKQLCQFRDKLEHHYRDMQDIEFTIQEDKLYILQTRSGKRTAHAAVRTAVEMVKEKMIDQKTAILRVKPSQLDQLLHPTFDDREKKHVIAKGLPASPGAATGKVVFDADDAEERHQAGEAVILVRIETSPEDIGGMHAAQGILTARGGMTSHAAVVARGMGKCCVAGCGDIVIDYDEKQFTAGKVKVKEGDFISLNGSTGEVYLGKVATQTPELSGDFGKLMKWADQVRKLNVRTNADTPHDAKVARKFGAEGIGLCRTEHMFFQEDRIMAMREMILADDVESREKALSKLLPFQRKDFEGIFEAMDGLPVTIRLLDPPLHEFVPHTEESQQEMSKVVGIPPSIIKQKVAALHEFNPMLGHRGCRLGITYPEIYNMQTRAIIEAACHVKKKGIKVFPEIMIPLIGTASELSFLKKEMLQVIEDVFGEKKIKVAYKIGTMIEIPRAAIVADTVAEIAEFFSFGTNDLTQMTFGYSRDDAGMFLKYYIEKGILETDPFQTIDRDGVGVLIKWAIERGRKIRKDLKIGICGEHGGDPETVHFCHEIGMNYVSCSPFRVPIARLAAAQAAISKR
ncbi:MAG: pyruvate, phosphate dikinase [Candidatus Omnitrophica bacterium CG11_big_fil_rev_8_21_14_0_20_45_26]|uniref:Pyruvate, phosphate dikinase n=1 Tax=Candidatus Abzuiibacterium crystallinum TaxID=1974748 RepID=A0A2H0LLP3_9BACT|nr:MAG: pyruvate, phosphate dikinase [Candidatus Omnitrophica bacterium CG11_big_fil_rev_8_21_14_0_20_45_26]PIW63562.1 MAG: pyruvate, phosphate dikinase [Candidatus Omnitrophica bacterium CG12_big_fil_rev_8_21_14_0_65_45_16]